MRRLGGSGSGSIQLPWRSSYGWRAEAGPRPSTRLRNPLHRKCPVHPISVVQQGRSEDVAATRTRAITSDTALDRAFSWARGLQVPDEVLRLCCLFLFEAKREWRGIPHFRPEAA